MLDTETKGTGAVVVYARDPEPEGGAWRKLSRADQRRLRAFRRTP